MASSTRPTTEQITHDGEILHEYLNKEDIDVVDASKHGIIADGITDNTDAAIQLSLLVKSKTSKFLKVIFPRGRVKLGRQTLAGSTGKGYALRGAYEDHGLRGYIDFSERDGDVTIVEGYGTTFVLNDGMKIGSFDPVTGLPSADQVTLTPDTDKQATPGIIVALAGLKEVRSLGYKVDGSATGMIWGGRYGDNGWQIISFGIWCVENITSIFRQVESYNCGADSLYLSANATWSPTFSLPQRSVSIDYCKFHESRRQGISITGGQFIDINRTEIRRIGRYSTGAGSHYSGPEACIDIETEGATVQDVVIRNSQLIDGYYTLLSKVVDSNSRRCSVYNTVLRNQSTYTSVLNALPDLKFFNCTIEGGGIDSADLTSSQGSYPSLYSCMVTNNFNGGTVTGSRLVGKFGNIKDTIFRTQLHSQFTLPMLAISPDGNSLSSFANNTLVVYGDKTTSPKNLAGRVLIANLANLREIDLKVVDGTTGTGLCEVALSGCTTGDKGVISNTSNVVNSDGNTIAMPDGRWLIPGAPSYFYAQALLPAYTGASIGNDTNRVGGIYTSAGGGIHMKSANGTKYLATMSDLGAWVITSE